MQFSLLIFVSLGLVGLTVTEIVLTCRLREEFDLYGLYKEGDIILGGMFEINFKTVYPELSFTVKPEQLRCERFDFTGFQLAQSMAFAIEEINRDPALLPNITLGYRLYDNCENLAVALRATTALISGEGTPLLTLLHYLARVNFMTHYGDRVSFDENGDALAIYDVMNWQRADDGAVKTVTIGLFDESAPAGQELTLNEDKIFWNFESDSPPRSVCSESCQPGTRKATRKGEPLCCFDYCIECFKCPQEYWSNPSRDQCVLKEIEFLSYGETLGISLTTVSVFGAFISAAVLAVFIYYRNTPVVRANNSELSFLLLLSLILCFLCSLLFIGQPLHLTCMLRHVVFGISFVLCISCILVKTIVVIMAFRATLPDNNVMKWFGAAQQRGTVFVFTVIQALICIIWLSTASPVPFKNTQYQNSKIIFQCNVGSITGFSFLLGYIGLLASVCFLLAFLARNLPDNFNEAKFITFSMLIFCAVWIAFIPAYVSSPGKYSDAVEIFAILASSFGLLFAIFAPKCYIILLHPEKNTKKALMGRAAPKN
ncbi:CASR protein, partial [Atractosteus spatula]|nr:CASR protein [Atractosteus spatula]